MKKSIILILLVLGIGNNFKLNAQCSSWSPPVFLPVNSIWNGGLYFVCSQERVPMEIQNQGTGTLFNDQIEWYTGRTINNISFPPFVTISYSGLIGKGLKCLSPVITGNTKIYIKYGDCPYEQYEVEIFSRTKPDVITTASSYTICSGQATVLTGTTSNFAHAGTLIYKWSDTLNAATTSFTTTTRTVYPGINKSYFLSVYSVYDGCTGYSYSGGWRSISAGKAHTLAIKSDSTLWAWGENNLGQLGDGTNTSSLNPIQIGTSNDWIKIAVGTNHSLAIKADGTLWSWGYNEYGQLGDGGYANVNSPVQVPGSPNNNWIDISGGEIHSLGLRSNGLVYAWGGNNEGQLGNGSTVLSTINVPTLVPIPDPVISINSGDWHNLALTTQGKLYAWGRNSFSQLGGGSNPQTTPLNISVGSSTIDMITQIAAGANHSLVLTTNGKVWITGSASTFTLVPNVPNKIEKIIAGGNQNYIITHKTLNLLNQVYRWGQNDYGQLGLGHTNLVSTPTTNSNTDGTILVSANLWHTVSIKDDGTLYSSGLGALLGNGNYISQSNPVSLNNVVADSATNWHIMAAGLNHSLGIKTDGSLWAWGNNANGQLGNGSNSASTVPVQIGNETNWDTVVAGFNFSLAIKTDGSLWAWGYNSYGQLGDGTTTSKTIPVQIGTSYDWKMITTGYFHSLAIKGNGTLWAWGININGQLGDGTIINRKSPVQIGSNTSWKTISSKGFHSLALRNDNTLWAWGKNSDTQLGIGIASDKTSPFQVGTDTDWSSISAGYLHSMGLKINNTVWCWGSNAFGQLGDGTYSSRSTPRLTLSNSTKIAAGYHHCLAISLNNIKAWGRNNIGQLGIGATTNTDVLSPVTAPNSHDAQNLITGYYHNFVFKKDESLWAFGTNLNGEYGIENTTSSNKMLKISDESFGLSIIVKPIPSVHTRTNNFRCGPGSVSLAANPANGIGTINWYQSLSGGTLLGTGWNFNTPAISNTSTFYVSANNKGCASTGSRLPVTATITPIPVWYKDADNDGYTTGQSLTQCNQPIGYRLGTFIVPASIDCNDTNASVNPGQAEICGNNVDDDCDGLIDEETITMLAGMNYNCMGNQDIISVHFIASLCNPLSGSTYRAELSNASGSFASPVILASQTVLDTISYLEFTLPSGLPAGTGYRIRVKSNNPNCVSTDNGTNIIIQYLDDGNACTYDACNPATGIVTHLPENIDDGNICTIDACDPIIGITHTPENISDNNACTEDVCDSITGLITHLPISIDDGNMCTLDACDPVLGITHTPIIISDGNACTLDECDPLTGIATYSYIDIDDGNACTIDACDPVFGLTHTLINISDGNACTIDVCDSITGISTDTYLSIDDGNACTIDACDPVFGVTHTLINISDGNACTMDVCDSITGISTYTYLSIDDGNACTIDACDPLTGVTNTYVNIDDGNDCTNDECNSFTGLVTHTNSTLAMSVTAGSILCYNGTTQVSVAATGGALPYTGTGTFSGYTAGTHFLNVVDGNGCLVTSDPITITEPAKVVVNTSSTLSSGSNGTATAIPSGGIPGYTYAWTPGGQSTQTATGLAVGNYYVMVTDANGCSVTTPVIINTSCITPAAPGLISGPFGACGGQNGIVFSIDRVPNALSYSWTLPTGAIGYSTDTSITVNFHSSSFNGGYICVIANGTCNSGASTCKSIQKISSKPGIPESISGPVQLCPPGTTTATYSTIAAPRALSYLWEARGGLTIASGQGSLSIVVNVPSNFTGGDIRVKAVNCKGTSSTRTLVVHSGTPSVPGSISGNSSVCKSEIRTYSVSSLSMASSYFWSVSGGAIIQSGQGTNSVSINFGSAVVNAAVISVVAENICGPSSAKTKNISVNLTCRVINDNYEIISTKTQIPGVNSLEVYPNPTKGNFTLEFLTERSSRYLLKIIDVTGRLIYTEEIDAAEGLNRKNITLRGISSGMYLLGLNCEGIEIKTLRIVIE